MTTLSTARTTSPQRSNRARWTILARLRKSILVTHVISAGAWIGIDVISIVLVAIGWVRAGDDRTAVYRALADLGATALALLTFAAVLSVFKPWGRVRR